MFALRTLRIAATARFMPFHPEQPLQRVQVLIRAMSNATPEKFKLIFYTPPTSLPAIKSAIFATGAGTYAKYTECCFTIYGTGQFRPSAEANPHIGKPGDLEEVEEARCEILCVGREVTRKAVEELKRTHPYEEIAYEVYRIEGFY